jgi:2-polyprenyl-3-methyl-5-hydroxy-6-metoxy-1,4-benzoquinol methylase
MLNLRPTDLVLDLGCGEGLLVYKFRPHCAKISGIDISEKAVKIASRINPDSDFYRKDIVKTDFPPKSFDVVYCFEVLQYIKHKEPVFKEMFRLARRSVVFSAPNFNSFWAQIVKARQTFFGVRGYPDSPTKQWIITSQIVTTLNVNYKLHSLASRVQRGFPGLIKYYLRRLLRNQLFIIMKIDL